MTQSKPKITVVTPTIRGTSGLKSISDSLKKQKFKDYEWLVRSSEVGVVDFNKVMNDMIREARGELIVSVQDYISFKPDALQKWWDAHEKEPAFYTASLSRGGKKDWRWHREDKKCNWQEWEIDWGSAPTEWLKSIGGFDEELDQYWGFDNVNVGLRADLAGYPFRLLKGNSAIAFDHDETMHHPYRERRNPDFHNERLDDFRQGLTLPPL